MFSVILACVLLTARDSGDSLDVLPTTINGVAREQMLHAYLMGLAPEAFGARKARYDSLDAAEEPFTE